MNYKVENIEACSPVNSLIKVLQEKGCVIDKSKVGDYHFNELYFLLKTENGNVNLDDISIDNIGRHSEKTFFCKCHWSIVEVR